MSEMEPPVSVGGNTPRLVSATAIDPYDEEHDPDGSAFLANELKNYDRISLLEACSDPKRIDEYDNNGNPNLIIWIKNNGRWTQLDNSNGLVERWRARLTKSRKSVCGSLVRDLLGLSDADYAKVLSKFEHRAGFDGIYRTTKKNMEKFAVVVEMPRGMSLDSKLVTGGLAGLAGLSALAATGLGVGFRKRGKELKELEKLRPNSRLDTLYKQLINLQKQKESEPVESDDEETPGRSAFNIFRKKPDPERLGKIQTSIDEAKEEIARAHKSRLLGIDASKQIYKGGEDKRDKEQIYQDAYGTLERLNGYLNNLGDTRNSDIEKRLSLPLINEFVEQAYKWMNIKESTPKITEITRGDAMNQIGALQPVLDLINGKIGDTIEGTEYETREQLQAAIRKLIEAKLTK
jgi:hypothetical protein